MKKIKSTCTFVSHCLVLLLLAISAATEEQVDINRSDFPDGFLFGASTSAYQVRVFSLYTLSPVFFFFQILFFFFFLLENDLGPALST